MLRKTRPKGLVFSQIKLWQKILSLPQNWLSKSHCQHFLLVKKHCNSTFQSNFSVRIIVILTATRKSRPFRPRFFWGRSCRSRASRISSIFGAMSIPWKNRSGINWFCETFIDGNNLEYSCEYRKRDNHPLYSF